MTNKCDKCGAFIEKGYLCMRCSRNVLESNINRQILKGNTTLTIPINDLLAKETADLIIETLNHDITIKGIELIARGRHIGRAVDVLEILKRDIPIKDCVFTTSTERLINRESIPIKVSSTKIKVYV